MKKRRKLYLKLAALPAILVLAVICFLNLGNCLVAEDEAVPGAAAIVLMGSGPDRMLGAVELYRAGYLRELVMVRNLIGGYDLAVSQGVRIPHDTDLAGAVAVQLGVPADMITVLPGDARSTQEEALQVRRYLQEKEEIETIIVVTSRSHSGRSKRIFIKALRSLERPVRVLSCPTGCDSFDEKHWWRDREDLEQVVYEYIKLFNFYFWEQFSL
ncbi:MAG: YdcF family protein [Firmicutes bacterium]|nr:YdcF family protein [Bacillota bacterium]